MTVNTAYSTGGATQWPYYGNDLFTDPWLAASQNSPVGAFAGSVGGPAVWTLQFPPVPISSVVFINRCDGGFNARINTTTPGIMNLVDANSTILSTRTISSMSVSVWNFPNMAQQGPIFPNSSLAPASVQALQTSQVYLNTLVRYINITSAPGKCLYFREIYVLDATLTNVALYKPTMMGGEGSQLNFYTDPLAGFVSYPSYGTDGIIDQDGPQGNMVNLPCDGTGWWTVDLGGVYNVVKVIYFNRYPLTAPTTVGQALGAQANGATLTYLNAYGVSVGSYTLTGDMIQSIPFSNPPGAYKVTISTVATGNVLNFVEAMVFSNTGQNVAASILGAASGWSSGAQFSTQSNIYGNDMFTDPYLAAAAPTQLIAGTSAAGAWTVTFPAFNPVLFPFGQPFPVSSVVFINRVDGGNNGRAAGAVVSLVAPNGTTLSTATLTSATVTVLNFPNNAQTGPIFPNSSLAQPVVTALQSGSVNQSTYVRYIQIAAAPGHCLYFRELMAFDVTYTNVALYKPTTQGSQANVLASYKDPALGFTSFSSYGVDGIIDVSGSHGLDARVARDTAPPLCF